MKSIKDLSIFHRLILLFSVVVLLLLANMFIFRSLNSQNRNSLYSLKILYSNQILNKEILQLSNEYTSVNEILSHRLRTKLNEYNQNSILLREGGVYENDFNYKALKEKHHSILDSLAILNKSFIELVNLMIKDPSANTNLVIHNKGKNLLKSTKKLQDSIFDDINNKSDKITVFQRIGIVFLTLTILFIIFFLQINVFNPLKYIHLTLNKISKGDVFGNNFQEQNQNSEIERINKSINKLIDRLQKSISFINETTLSIFDSNIETFGKSDKFGDALLQIRNTFIKKSQEEKERQKENKQRDWINSGLNKFSEILRHDNTTLEELCSTIISDLVKQLQANQGGFFIFNNSVPNNQFLELTASIAYDRKKHNQKKIFVGEGILGSCILEKETVYLSNIPDEYIETESGLGDSNPRYLLIVPLKIKDILFGIVEIASFNEIQNYEIEFIETLSENIATAIKSLQTNIQTSELLEQAQSQTEKLHSQEEEMRQNMEELQATQEESSRKAKEMQSIFNAFNTLSGTFEIDTEGYIISFNDLMLRVLDTSADQLLNRNHRRMIEANFQNENEYTKMWDQLLNGQKYRNQFKINIDAGEVWLDISYTPIRNDSDSVYKILALANNITLKKIQEMELLDNFELIKMKEEQLKLNIEDIEKSKITLIEDNKLLQKEIDELKQKNEVSTNSFLLSKESQNISTNKIKEKDTAENKKTEKTISGKTELKENYTNNIEKNKTNENVNTDDLIIGIPSIDEQHNKLVKLYNNVLSSIKQKKSKEEIQEIIYDTNEYTRYHFSYEEKYFKEFKYKNSAEHIKEHQNFIAEIELFQKNYNSNNTKQPVEELKLLLNQFLSHIIKMDKEYVQLFIKKGLS